MDTEFRNRQIIYTYTFMSIWKHIEWYFKAKRYTCLQNIFISM